VTAYVERGCTNLQPTGPNLKLPYDSEISISGMEVRTRTMSRNANCTVSLSTKVNGFLVVDYPVKITITRKVLLTIDIRRMMKRTILGIDDRKHAVSSSRYDVALLVELSITMIMGIQK